MLDAAQHLAAIGKHDARSIALERVAEGIVRGQEEPAIAARLGQRLAGAVGKHIGVEGERNRVRRARLAGEVGGGGARIEMHHVLLARHVAHRERNAGIRRVDDGIDLVIVDPLPGDVGAEVRLVLVVAAQHIDLPALRRQAGVLDRHLDRCNRIGTADVGIEARHVVEYTDLDDLVVGEDRRRKGQTCNGKKCGGTPRGRNIHVIPPI